MSHQMLASIRTRPSHASPSLVRSSPPMVTVRGPSTRPGVPAPTARPMLDSTSPRSTPGSPPRAPADPYRIAAASRVWSLRDEAGDGGVDAEVGLGGVALRVEDVHRVAVALDDAERA